MLIDTMLKGVQKIKKVYMKKNEKPRFDIDPVTGGFKRVTEWVLETDGTDLKEVLSMDLKLKSKETNETEYILDAVDSKRTTCNSTNEIHDCLGIEAGRASLLREIRAVLDTYGIYVNYRHLANLCDVMTQRGKLSSLTRHGINR
mmetsp:Transcript_19984/g.30731  ORF Transcript_19984/g.30731 Transcript_19984/m.30731 type:complete len:145 (+) Transcript_19984:149-583(+)